MTIFSSLTQAPVSLLVVSSGDFAAASVEESARLDPVKLLLHADIVVQIVMGGLLISSLLVWAIIVGFSLRMSTVSRRCKKFEAEFWKAEDFDALVRDTRGKYVPSASIAAAGLNEWRRSVLGKGEMLDRDGTRQRLASAMESQVALEADQMAQRLGFLATVGSVAPFVGLFGTVWGIMNSFFEIGVQESSSLAVVAPGISEALFATAIGLFAAIPAVIAFNRFSQSVNGLESRLQRFADRFHSTLSRELERQ